VTESARDDAAEDQRPPPADKRRVGRSPSHSVATTLLITGVDEQDEEVVTEGRPRRTIPAMAPVREDAVTRKARVEKASRPPDAQRKRGSPAPSHASGTRIAQCGDRVSHGTDRSNGVERKTVARR